MAEFIPLLFLNIFFNYEFQCNVRSKPVSHDEDHSLARSVDIDRPLGRTGDFMTQDQSNDCEPRK